MSVTYVQALWNHILHIDADGESALCGWNWAGSSWNILRDNTGGIDVCVDCEQIIEGTA